MGKLAIRKTNGVTPPIGGGGLLMTTAASSEIQERYASHLAAQRELAPKVTHDSIKTSPTGFKVGDTRLGPEIDVIILGFSYTSSFYGLDEVYDPDNTKLPVCYAVGRDPDSMVAAESVVEPIASACNDCPYSQFKSASVGRGKACREYIRLAVVSADSFDDGAAPKTLYINLPPTARKGFGEFVSNVNGALRVPLFAVAAQLYIEELKAGFSVGIELLGVIDDIDVLDNQLAPMADEVSKVIFDDPKFSQMDNDDDDEEDTEPKPKPATRKPRQKTKPAQNPVEEYDEEETQADMEASTEEALDEAMEPEENYEADVEVAEEAVTAPARRKQKF